MIAMFIKHQVFKQHTIGDYVMQSGGIVMVANFIMLKVYKPCKFFKQCPPCYELRLNFLFLGPD